MQVKQHIKLFSLLFVSMIAFGSIGLRADEDMDGPYQDNSYSDLMDNGQTRGCLSVPDAIKMTPCTSFTKLVSPGDMGRCTLDFACCKVFQLTNSKTYSTTPSSNPANPLVRMNGKGATFDLCHNCITLNKQTGGCDMDLEHSVAIELGYSPNDLGANTQPDSLTVENGIICGWDIGIMVHAGVRNVTLRNLVLTKCTLPIAMIGTRAGGDNVNYPNAQDDSEVCTVHMENITIIGDCTPRLDCLKWIRAKLTDGNSKDGGGAAFNPYRYDDLNADETFAEVQLKECDPVGNGTDDALPSPTADEGLYVYSGIYAHNVANISLKNVSVSNMGYDGEVGTDQSEATAVYGMYFRYCNGVIMEDVESTKNKSGRTAIGMYFDHCCMVSAKNANITGNHVTQVGAEAVAATLDDCPAGRWAAAVALKDTNVYELCDAILSKTFGLETSYGVRTIFNPVDSVNSLGFENVTADMLRGDDVIGFDFGDRVVSAANRKAVQKLRMKNISVSSARGKNVSTETDFPDNTIAGFFNGIYFGPKSKDIDLDEIAINSNVATTASEGIALEDTGATAADGVNNVQMNNLSISGNTSGIAEAASFVGIGTLSRVVAQTAEFNNWSISNVYLHNNGSSILISGPINNMTMDKVDAGNNEFGAATFLVAAVDSLTVTNSRFNNTGASGTSGFEIAGAAKSIAFENCYFLNNQTIGLNFGSTLDNLKLTDVCISNNGTNGMAVVGAAKNLVLNHVDISNSGTGGTQNGLDFGSMLDNLKMFDVCISNNTGAGMSVISLATSVSCVGGQFNNNVAGDGLWFQAGVNGLTLENIVAKNNGGSGVFNASAPATSVSCTNCQFSDNDGSGLSLGAANGVNLIDTVANKNGSSGLLTTSMDGLSATRCQFSYNTGSGLELGAASGITLDHVVANANTAGMGGGFFATATNGLGATASEFNKNTGSGLSLGAANGVTLDHVTANNNQAGSGAGVLSTTTNGFGATKSEFNQNLGMGLNLGAGSGVDLNDVSALDNGANGLGLTAQGLSCKCCRFDHNGGTGIAAGGASGVHLQDTTANRNDASGFTMGTAEGITCDGCQFNSNTGDGILASALIDNVTLLNSSLDNNTANGFSAAAGTNSANSLVFKDTTFNHNPTAGFSAVGLVNSMTADRVTFNENGIGVNLQAGLDNGTWNDVQVNHNMGIGVTAGTGAIKNFVGTKVSADFNVANGFNLGAAEHFSLDGFSVNGHTVATDNAGIRGTDVEHMVLKNGFVNNNVEHGILLGSANGLLMEHVTVNGTTRVDAGTVYGIRVGDNALAATDGFAKNVHLKNVEVSHTHSGGGAAIDAIGIAMLNLRDGDFENVTVSNTTSVFTGGTGNAKGIFIDSVAATDYAAQGLSMDNVIVRETTTTGASDKAYNVHISGGAYGIHANNINFSGASSDTGNNTEAIGWLMEVKDETDGGTPASTRAYESIYVDGFHCDDQKGGLARGIAVQGPSTLTNLVAGTRLLSNAEFKNGTADNNLAGFTNATGVAGILLDQNAATTQVGPCDVLLENVSVSKNVMTGDGGAYGLLVFHGDTITCKGVKANNNRNTTGTAQVFGMQFSATDGTSTTNLTIEDSTANYNQSFNGVAGIDIVNGKSVTLKNVKANHNESGGSASVFGIDMHISNAAPNEVTTDNVTIIDTVCSGNKSLLDGNVTGIHVEKGNIIQVDGLIANDNVASSGAEVRGIYFDGKPWTGATAAQRATEATVGCQLNNMQACGNEAVKRAYGIEIYQPTGVHMQHIDASSNKSTGFADPSTAVVLHQAAGLFLQGGCSVTIEDVHANVNEETETEATNLARDIQDAPSPALEGTKAVDGGTAESVVNDSVYVARHFPVAHRAGAYGILADGTADLSIDGGTACKNKGVRAFGVMVRGANNPDDFAKLHPQYKMKNPVIKNLDASENHAIGGAWHSATPFSAETAPNVAIAGNQSDTIFGGATGNVDMVQAYRQYLKSLNQFNNTIDSTTGGSSAFSLCDEDNDPNDMGPASCVASSLEIIWSAIAKLRRFSTAVGIGIYNADCATVDGCRAMGNHSEKDGAAGIAIYGCCNNRGHLVQNNVTACNAGWTDSTRGYNVGSDIFKFDIDGQIDITEWNPLSTFVGLKQLDTTLAAPYGLAAIVTPIPALLTEGDDLPSKPTDSLGQNDFGDGGTAKWTLNRRKLTVGFEGDGGATTPTTNYLFDFATAAPLTAGILLEGQRDSNVLNNNSYTNTGNAGLAFGIASDAASSSMFSDNKATSNEADAAGFALGLADISYSTANVWYRNWMYANRVDVFMNSSLLIVFDTIASGSQALPLQPIFQGNIDALQRSLQLDNIIVKFVSCRQIKDCIGDCVRHKLADGANFIPAGPILSAGNETVFAGCTACL